MDDAPPPLAVVIGGTSGIGLASADRLMQDGFDVLITGRDQDRGREAEHALSEKHRARRCQFLFFEAADWDHYAALQDAIGPRPVEVAVISAAFGLQVRVTDTPHDIFLDMLAVNVVAPLKVVQALRPQLSRPSSIILISSDAGIEGEQALGAYSVTKAALNMLGRMMALDLAPSGTRVNIICPGDTTPGMRYLLRPGETVRNPDDYRAWSLPPRGRLGQAADTAEMVSFLASSRSDFMVGSITLVDGGSRAGRPDAFPRRQP